MANTQNWMTCYRCAERNYTVKYFEGLDGSINYWCVDCAKHIAPSLPPQPDIISDLQMIFAERNILVKAMNDICMALAFEDYRQIAEIQDSAAKELFKLNPKEEEKSRKSFEEIFGYKQEVS